MTGCRLCGHYRRHDAHRAAWLRHPAQSAYPARMLVALLLEPDATLITHVPRHNEEREAAGSPLGPVSIAGSRGPARPSEAMNQSDHRNESTRGHYTFGDNAVAAVRLQRLADLFRPALETFVTEHLPRPIGHVLDLGCGPGHTTRALAALLTAARVTGLDHSTSFIEEAARAPVANVVYRVGDVTRPHDEAVPDVPPADGLYLAFSADSSAAPWRRTVDVGELPDKWGGLPPTGNRRNDRKPSCTRTLLSARRRPATASRSAAGHRTCSF